MSSIIKVEPLQFPWQTKDPFLFCVYHFDQYPESNGALGVKENELVGRPIGQDFSPHQDFRMYHGQQVPGFPYHPHRGFETITIAKRGYIDHSDSLGAAGRFGRGDVQWMTAGKGVLHSEMFPLLHDDKKNPLELFQIWLNLPSKAKMVEPHFKMLWKEDIPVIEKTDTNGNSTRIELVAGQIDDVQALEPSPDSWAADLSNGVLVLVAKMEADASWALAEANQNLNRSIYVYKGLIEVEGKHIESNHVVEAHADKPMLLKAGKEETQLLILQGKPINEPIAQHGPFVMNSQAEIMQAMRDYQETQFGGWPWPKQEMTHGEKEIRFAQYPDGSKEFPS